MGLPLIASSAVLARHFGLSTMAYVWNGEGLIGRTRDGVTFITVHYHKRSSSLICAVRDFA